MIKLFTLLVSILFINANCDKDIVDPPPVPTDTIITVEKELADGEQPAVSPDGSKIAFVRKGDIWVMDTSGTNQKQLTNSADIDIIPRWKPDGLSIGFIRTTTGEYNKGRIFTVLPTGGGETQIIQNYFAADSLLSSSSNIGYPIWNWSPSGQFVAFFEQQGYKTYLRIVNVANDNETYVEFLSNHLESKSGNRSSFVWTSNNGEIIFNTENMSGRTVLVIKNIITGNLIQDSMYYNPSHLCELPLTNKFSFDTDYLEQIVVKGIGLHSAQEYFAWGGGGMKSSPDGDCLLFEWQGSVSGPFGYRFSRLSILRLSNGKQYLLTTKGDINQYNYRFDWGKKKNEIFFERFKKINKIAFQFAS